MIELPKQITITPEHLDRAMAGPWSPSTCLIAQVARDLGATPNENGTIEETYALTDNNNQVHGLMRRFDSAYSNSEDVDNERIAAIRAELPVTITI